MTANINIDEFKVQVLQELRDQQFGEQREQIERELREKLAQHRHERDALLAQIEQEERGQLARIERARRELEWQTWLERWNQEVSERRSELAAELREMFEREWHHRRQQLEQERQEWLGRLDRELQEWQRQEQVERHRRQEALLRDLMLLEPEDRKWHEEFERLQRRPQITQAEQEQLKKQRVIISQQKAEKLIKRKDVRDYLCPALQTLSGDTSTFGNTATQVLLAAVMAGQLSIPLVPVLFASIALVVSRMGIATLCADYDKKKADQK